MDRLRDRLRARPPSNAAGVAGALMGAILVAVGIALQEQGVGAGEAVRVLGGILLLGGLGVLLFGDSPRRAALVDEARRVLARYTTATRRWRRPNRVGVALVAIALLLHAPALIAQILFGTAFAILVIVPATVLFWVGLVLIVWARLGRGAGGRGAGPRGPSRRP